MDIGKNAVSLRAEHEPEAIRERLERKKSYSYLGDAVLGAIDGCVTTFAVVSGVLGGGLSPGVALVLGFANLVADGFSMAVSNYQRSKSEAETVEKARRNEERHIEMIPEGEKEEIRQIYSRKGFRERLLDQVVDVITGDRGIWIDSMITEEWGLALGGPRPIVSALTTFAAFLVVGSIPLIPFLLGSGGFPHRAFIWSASLTLGAFFFVGLIKGQVLKKPRLRSGMATALVGGSAALLAFLIGFWLRGIANPNM